MLEALIGGRLSYVAVSVRVALKAMLKPTDPNPRSRDETSDHPLPAFSGAHRLALLVLFALILVAKLPRPWAEGRFQDEEATVFLAYAWHYPWSAALFRPFAGYWNFAADAAAVLIVRLERTGLLPLEHAPYVTMSLGLAAQMLPAVLVLTSREQWLSRRTAPVVALLLIAASPATEEVFFNVLHIQFQLALCAALILAFDAPSGRATRIGYNLLLFLGPLCGPGVIVILPLFALRWFLDRDGKRLMQFAALGSGTAIQLVLFFGQSPMRGHLVGPAMIAAAMFVRMIALRFLGPDFANLVAAVIDGSQKAGGTLWLWFALAAVLLFGGLIWVSSRRRDSALWLALSSLAIGAASLGFGMVRVNDSDLIGVVSGERYNFLPLALLGLAILALAMRPGIRGRPIYVSLCTLMLLTGAFYFSKTLVGLSSGPSWPSEVSAWRMDHHHPLAVWPRPFTADLSDETHPCSTPEEIHGQPKDPRYCESGWVAGFYRRR